MADIGIMNRKNALKWLTSAPLLLVSLLLPVSASADKKVVVIVSEPPVQKNSALAPPHAAPKPEQAIKTREPAITSTLIKPPDIDIFTPREKPLAFITLNSVLFAHNGTALDNQAKRILNDVAAALQNNSAAERLLINGHADKTASDHYNAKLSAKRAFVVREYLRHMGVPTTLLHTVSWGEGHPTDEHWTHNGRKRNRRVELYLIQKQAAL